MAQRKYINNLPYYSLNQFMREQFGEKVVRIPIDLHRTCPNHENDNPGCIFCLPEAYKPPASHSAGDIEQQMQNISAHMSKFYRANKFIGYFQSGSNTAGPAKELESAYRQALAFENVVGISISTRPDCLEPEILGVLESLAKEHTIMLELGFQTAHDQTLKYVNRGHDVQSSVDAINKLKDIGIDNIVAHMILGLPNESIQQMHDSFSFFSEKGVQGFKIHHLQVVQKTVLAEIYQKEGFKTLDFEKYKTLIVDIVERLDPEIVLHRLYGSAPKDFLVAPIWPGSKAEQLHAIHQEFKRRATYQGKALL